MHFDIAPTPLAGVWIETHPANPVSSQGFLHVHEVPLPSGLLIGGLHCLHFNGPVF